MLGAAILIVVGIIITIIGIVLFFFNSSPRPLIVYATIALGIILTIIGIIWYIFSEDKSCDPCGYPVCRQPVTCPASPCGDLPASPNPNVEHYKVSYSQPCATKVCYPRKVTKYSPCLPCGARTKPARDCNRKRRVYVEAQAQANLAQARLGPQQVAIRDVNQVAIRDGARTTFGSQVMPVTQVVPTQQRLNLPPTSPSLTQNQSQTVPALNYTINTNSAYV